MKARRQIFFADLSRFRFILLDSSGQKLSSPHYGRAGNAWADFGKETPRKRAGSPGRCLFFTD